MWIMDIKMSMDGCTPYEVLPTEYCHTSSTWASAGPGKRCAHRSVRWTCARLVLKRWIRRRIASNAASSFFKSL